MNGEQLIGSPGRRGPIRRFAVVGAPIEHSLSPVLHRTAYRLLGIEDATYERYEVGRSELSAFLAGSEGSVLSGLSVTMPGKPEAFSLAAETDAISRRLGIANTLIRRPDGGWRAENHDVYGIAQTLRDHGAVHPHTGAVLGSGATALSAVVALIELGVTEILLTARTPEKLRPAERYAATAGVATSRIPWEESHRVLAADAAVSALALEGACAVATSWSLVPISALPVPGVFLDVLYDPWPAPLAEMITAAGGAVADGLEMLAHQADMQIRSMLGVERAPVGPMLDAARSALAERGSRP